MSAYDNKKSIPVLGEFHITLCEEDTTYQATICVVTGKENLIIGWETSKKIKLQSARDDTINRGESLLALQVFLSDFFDGLGQLNDQ